MVLVLALAWSATESQILVKNIEISKTYAVPAQKASYLVLTYWHSLSFLILVFMQNETMGEVLGNHF